MRVRFPFAGAFFVILILAGFGGLLPHSALPSTPAAPFTQSDKILHFFTFFALTIAFYFILDTTRRRVLHLTLLVCTLGLGVGSEVAQGLIPNDREFDPFDVLANVLGSLLAVGLANIYHRRSVERRRRAKYSALTGAIPEGEEDLELGEGSGLRSGEETTLGQETGVTPVSRTVEEELDNWDEHAPDDAWDEEDDITTADSIGTRVTPASSSVGEEEGHKKLAVD